MVDLPKPKTRRIIKARIQGKTNKEIAKVEYPNAKPNSGAELVSRQVRNNQQYYEQSKLLALKEHNITWSRIIRPISAALEANNRDEPDHGTRLRASKLAIELLQVKEMDNEVREKIAHISKDMDEIQLLRLFKNK